MVWWDIEKSLKDAGLRLGGGPAWRRPRSDAGSSRLPADVQEALRQLLHGQDRPAMRQLERSIAARCRRLRRKTPSRATLYAFLDRCPPHQYRIAELPAAVKEALYNLDPEGTVPGPQLAFYAFQYGDTRAMSFAAGLPWLDLHQASRMRGWRPRNLGLLHAVLRRRNLA
jgi:hypothetical protein